MSDPDTLAPVWIGAGRVAEMIGKTRKTVNSMAKTNRIPAYRPRGTRNWKFRSDDIQRWQEQNYNKAPIPKARLPVVIEHSTLYGATATLTLTQEEVALLRSIAQRLPALFR